MNGQPDGITSLWAERILAWGFSLSLHAWALLGATLLVFCPDWSIHHHCQDVIQGYPVRVVDPGDRNRDLINRNARTWNMARMPWDSDPGVQDGLGGPAGQTLHGIVGWDQMRFGRSAESAILAALRWLARHQNAEGGWGTIHVSCPCDAEPGESGEDITALVLQTFLAAGYSADSRMVYVDPAKPDQDLSFGDVIRRAAGGRDPAAEAVPYTPVPVDDTPILMSQRTEESGCFNGSWEPTPREGRVVITARNTLRLIAARKR